MSRENVEIVRRAYDEFLSRGELPLEVTHPDVRIDNVAESPIPGPYRGHEGMRQWWLDIARVIGGDDSRPQGSLGLELLEAIDAEDRVVGVVRFVGHSPSGFDLTAFPWAVVHRLEDGLVIRVRGYMSKAEALEAAGMGDR